MESLDSKIKYVWILQFSLIGLVVGILIYVPLMKFLGAAGLVIPVLTTALLFIYSFLKYRNWGFELREDHFYREHGVLKKVYSMVPHVRIQHIDTNRGPFERILGLSTLRIYTAGSKGADVKVPGLERRRAREIQERLREVAIESEKGFDAV